MKLMENSDSQALIDKQRESKITGDDHEPDRSSIPDDLEINE